ncbi:MAG: pyridoxal-phosphate dependent enzyme [Anaerolineae bacterium]|nr:pyridoxal-phosphate dependent enzyme [Anaerolineae bacterium]
MNQSDINDARSIIRDKLHRTPTVSASALGDMTGVQLFLKCEQFQKTGSFKPRGALNKLAHLSQVELDRGLVSASAGNHAQGLAFAARAFGARATIVMPHDAPQAKIDAVRGYGGAIVFAESVNTMFDKMRELEQEHGYTVAHPFDDPYVIAGQGTVGMEIYEDVPDVEYVFVPIGGGGLISGIATALKLNNPRIKIIGVESTAGGAYYASVRAGKNTRVICSETIAGGIVCPMIGENNYPLMQQYVDDVVKVNDDELKHTIRLLLERCKMMVEGAGAAATAAVLSNKYALPKDARVVTLLSGGNVDLARLQEWIQ